MMLNHRTFMGCIICSGVIYAIMAVFNVIGPFIIQDTLHLSSITYGHVAFLLGLMWFIGSLLNKRLLHYISTDQLLQYGFIAMVLLLFTLVLALPLLPLSLWTIVIPCCLIYIIGGMLMPCAFAMTLSQFSRLGGTVNALNGMVMMIVTSVMTLFASSLPTTSQIPLISLYLSTNTIALLVYRFMIKK